MMSCFFPCVYGSLIVFDFQHRAVRSDRLVLLFNIELEISERNAVNWCASLKTK